jgi:concentrative nucleoside transporter, CNT family
MTERLISLLGVVAMMGIAFLLCPPSLWKKINWRTIGLGMVLLIMFALLVLRTPIKYAFAYANGVVETLLAFSAEGAKFVFGDMLNTQSFGVIFAVQVLPTVIFFAAIMAILYHIRVMPFIISMMARFISKFLGVSGAESFSTVSDIFVGQTEAPLVIRPYIGGMTRSELMACMTAGFATTSGGVLAAYVTMLHGYVPGIAGHLIASSVMCAPASLVIAKLMLPEADVPPTMGNVHVDIPRTDVNIVDAAARGTTEGLKLAANIAAMLISFLAITAMINFGLHKLGTSFEQILGLIFRPLAWLMGVASEDIGKVATLLGKKMVLNEFVAYQDMGTKLLETNGTWLTERSRVIVSYALCGFANFGSIGIQIGGYGGLAPERRGDLSKIAFRAMIAGTLSTCMVAAIAGILL